MFVFSGARPVYLATAIVLLLITLQPVVLCNVDITTMNLLPIYSITILVTWVQPDLTQLSDQANNIVSNILPGVKAQSMVICYAILVRESARRTKQRE